MGRRKNKGESDEDNMCRFMCLFFVYMLVFWFTFMILLCFVPLVKKQICSTSPSGGNQVDGLPPASSFVKLTSAMVSPHRNQLYFEILRIGTIRISI